jgi:hypothetical protein
VLLVGPYSTGKTTVGGCACHPIPVSNIPERITFLTLLLPPRITQQMVQYLLGQAFPGMHTGPEPTTDRFIAVVHGNEEKIIQAR